MNTPTHCRRWFSVNLGKSGYSRTKLWGIIVLFGLFRGFVSPSYPATVDSVAEAVNFLDLSLEELSQVIVTSASRKAEAVANTPAAVFVISADDIRRSGATNLPEALRLAPGVRVSALGNNKWAVSIRGFSERFANKLLVLMDGRTLYSPLLSGVFWESQNIPLEIIERIEVIRGPAPLWGANAVNGVINIITKSADATLGGQLSVAAGTELRTEGFAQQGWKINEDTAIRVYAKAQDYGPSQIVTGGQGVDDWQNARAGFRLDRGQKTDRLLAEGELYNNRSGDRALLPSPTGLNAPTDFTQEVRGGYLLSRWERQTSPKTGYTLQGYFEYQHIDHVWLTYQNTTFDLDFQQQLALDERQDLIYGLGYRRIASDFTSSAYVTFDSDQRTDDLFSAYIQDDITLIPDRWHVILGSRFEHNHYTGFEAQPNARLLWTPDSHTSLWAAAARVVRTPSLGEADGDVWLFNAPIGALMQPLPPGLDPQLPVALISLGDPNRAAEILTGLDLGWRRQWSPSLSLDVAGFYYDYDDLVGYAPGSPDFSNPALIVLPQITNNESSARVYGLEFATDWRPRTDWRVQANYGWIKQLGVGDGSAIPPTHQFSLRSSWNINPAWQWDIWLRSVSALKYPATPAYTTLDTRLGWKPRPDLEIALVGQNLLKQAHPEFITGFVRSIPSEVERGVYLKMDFKF